MIVTTFQSLQNPSYNYISLTTTSVGKLLTSFRIVNTLKFKRINFFSDGHNRVTVTRSETQRLSVSFNLQNKLV